VNETKCSGALAGIGQWVTQYRRPKAVSPISARNPDHPCGLKSSTERTELHLEIEHFSAVEVVDDPFCNREQNRRS
jgi:hypothetical protein